MKTKFMMLLAAVLLSASVKRLFLLVAVMATSLCTSAQNGWESISSRPDQNKAYRKVLLRKGDFPDILTVKDGMVWLSEKPGGEAEGYYGVQTANGFLYNGSKEKVKVKNMKPVSGGWYEFDFGKDLYILEVKDFAHLDNIKFMPSSTVASPLSNQINSSNSRGQSLPDNVTEVINSSNNRGQNLPNKVTKVNRTLETITPSNDLSADGWTLSKTSVKDGITCETYVKEVDDLEIFLFNYKRGNGDFFSSDKEIDPNNVNFDNSSYNYKWHDSEGVLKVYQKKPYRQQFFYPNGMVLDKTEDQKYLYKLENLNIGYVVHTISTEDFWSPWVDYNYYNWFRPNYYTQDVPTNLFRTDGIAKAYGFLVDDRFYRMKSKSDIDPTPILQLIKGKYFIICPTDTIVDVKYVNTKDTIINEEKLQYYKYCEVFYKNGDRYKGVSKDPYEGYAVSYQIATLHRMGGVLKITRNGTTFTKDDGTVIQVDLIYNKEGNGGCTADASHLVYLFSEDSLTFSGKVTYPDGTTDELDRGVRRSYLNSLPTAEEKKKEAIRKSYIKKYGYYPGDYDNMTEVLKPGRKFGAIEEYFIVGLISTNGTSKRYRVYHKTWGGDRYAYVWVRNGVITSVTF